MPVAWRAVLQRTRAGWQTIEHGLTSDLWSIAELDGRVFMASMETVYELRGATLEPVDFGADSPSTSLHLSATSGLLWSIGAKDVFALDKTGWQRVL